MYVSVGIGGVLTLILLLIVVDLPFLSALMSSGNSDRINVLHQNKHIHTVKSECKRENVVPYATV